jgi:hypothetical protein
MLICVVHVIRLVAKYTAFDRVQQARQTIIGPAHIKSEDTSLKGAVKTAQNEDKLTGRLAQLQRTGLSLKYGEADETPYTLHIVNPQNS